MKNGPLYCMLIAAVCTLIVPLSLLAAVNPPQVGEQLPDISLPVPENPIHKKYFGLSEGDTFEIPQIRAKVIIIEIFSMYCPYCQREAPEVNRLYEKIEGNKKLKGKIKIIGIGAGNSPFEVDIFRKKYNVLFPLFPDNSYSIHKRIGEVRTPYFIAIKINKNRTHKVIYSKLGGLKGANHFLKTILDISGLGQEQ